MCAMQSKWNNLYNIVISCFVFHLYKKCVTLLNVGKKCNVMYRVQFNRVVICAVKQYVKCLVCDAMLVHHITSHRKQHKEGTVKGDMVQYRYSAKQSERWGVMWCDATWLGAWRTGMVPCRAMLRSDDKGVLFCFVLCLSRRHDMTRRITCHDSRVKRDLA